jgi:MoxR-like ATPase
MSKKQGKSIAYEYHGTMLTADRIMFFLEHIYNSNLTTVEADNQGKKVPICIWGKHGIGKTSLPEQLAENLGIGFEKISPAQFEEMGDLLGMPSTGIWVTKNDQSKLVDKDNVDSYINAGWSKDNSRPSQTITAAPQWVPNVDLGAPEKGIFVIDDFNRAGKRIINGIMDLLQNGGLATWKLPKGWSIMLTANPGGGDYQVTELDGAQMTRMTHISMEFEEKAWAKWALSNNIDERVVNFVLSHPELIRDGELTTPRSIEHFANNIRNIKNLKENLDMVMVLSNGSLDPNAAVVFTTFINDNLTTLKSPKEILEAKDFEKTIEKGFIEKFSKGAAPRVDVLSVLSTRIIFYCTDTLKGKLTKLQEKNLKAYINIKSIPNDIRLNMAQELIQGKLKRIMADPEIGKLLLNRM